MGAGFARQAGTVGEQFFNGDGGIVGAGGLDVEPGEIVGDCVVEVNFSGVAQLHDGGGGKQFAVGCHAEQGGRSHGSVRVDVGVAEAFGPHELLIVHDAHGDTG